MSIYRTLIWFQDGREKILDLSDKFFPYSVLSNRLLNQHYDGKKIKYINIYFMTEVTYIVFPHFLKRVEYIMDHVRTYGDFDYHAFVKLPFAEQKRIVWTGACKQLENAGLSYKNEKLASAAIFAMERGLEMNLVADYKLIEQDGTINGKNVTASIWAKFPQSEMLAIFILESEGKILMTRQLDKTVHGVEFFLEMFKKIEFKNTQVLIKGHRDVQYLPLKIEVDPKLLAEN